MPGAPINPPAAVPTAGAVLLAAPASGDDALLWALVAGKPLLARPLAALRASAGIGPLVLVVPRSRLAEARRLIAAEGFAQTHAIGVPAGLPLATALERASAALTSPRRRPRPAAPQHPASAGPAPALLPDLIVLHDATRPLVTPEQVRGVVAAAAAEPGLAVGTEPVKETIKRVARGRVIETLPRDELAQLIPPLAMRAELLSALLEASAGGTLTRLADLVGVALTRGVAVRAVPLAGTSLVLAAPEDVAVAAALLRKLGAPGAG